MKPDAIFSCPSCGGRGCEACGDRGEWSLTECPKTFVGNGLSEGMRFADLARDGAWPEDGGTLKQSAWFLDFCHWYWSELDTAKGKLHGRKE